MTRLPEPATKIDAGVADLERVHAVFSNPDLYTRMANFGSRDSTKGGRPRRYPLYLFVAYGALRAVYNSARAVDAALQGPFVWAFIRRAVHDQFPDDPTMWLPDTPPSRSWYVKTKRRLARADLAQLQQALTASGVETARELGLLDPDGPGSRAHPDAARMVYCDGKAIRQMFNNAPGDTREVECVDPGTGEITIEHRPLRADPDARVHVTGDNRQVHGSKYWHAEVRDERRHSRVFLAVDHAPTEKNAANSEADVAVRNLIELAPRIPGAIGVIADTVFRGTHIDTLVRPTGWIIMNPTSAKTVDAKTRARTEKELHVRDETFNYVDGATEDVQIWSVGGRLCRLAYTDDGTTQTVPLERTGNLLRQNANGAYRDYVEYHVPDPRRGPGHTIREAILQGKDDTFNRPELIRQIPAGDPDYQRLYGRRSDAESANRAIDDDLYLRRAVSVGAKAQLFDLITHAFAQNSLARYRHGKRPPPAVAA